MDHSGSNRHPSTRWRLARLIKSWVWPVILATGAALVLAGCSNGGNGELEEGNQASFCRIVTDNDPISLAPVEVLASLAEVAPPEVDAAVEELLEAAEQLAKLESNSKKQLALEFEIRFSDEYIGSRKQVEGYALANCVPSSTTSGETNKKNDADGSGTTTTSQVSTIKG